MNYDKIKLAWSIWMCCNLSYLKIIGSGFAFATTNNECNSTTNRKNRSINKKYSDRLANTTIYTSDAIQLIKELDSKDTFFYLDPPYDNSNCGNYEGTQEVFDRLL
jgi:DNA adenine methylase